jgi:YggT family protein
MLILKTTYLFIMRGVIAVAGAAILLIILRSLFNYMDKNPFTWSSISVRRATDPVILPVRRAMVSFRIDPAVAPFIAVILILIAGYFVVQIAGSVLNTIAGILYALTSRSEGVPVAIVGYLLLGFLGLYTLTIFVRIIFSWGTVGYGNRWMRFLIRTTEPLLGPLRRMVPPVQRFDISPIVAFLILWLLQAVVSGTLLKGWPINFL